MVGSVAVLAGAANTPVACVILGMELFGGSGAVLFALACTIAYVSSGRRGIYGAPTVPADGEGQPRD
jgi:H+/Cl- antiporter ClcA